MPKVGNREFPYTSQGQANAKAYGRRTGQPVRRQNNPSSRGAVNNFMNRSRMQDLAGAGINLPRNRVQKLQLGLNRLNRNNSGYNPLRVDGQMGPKTSAALKGFLGGVRPNRPASMRPNAAPSPRVGNSPGNSPGRMPGKRGY